MNGFCQGHEALQALQQLLITLRFGHVERGLEDWQQAGGEVLAFTTFCSGIGPNRPWTLEVPHKHLLLPVSERAPDLLRGVLLLDAKYTEPITRLDQLPAARWVVVADPVQHTAHGHTTP